MKSTQLHRTQNIHHYFPIGNPGISYHYHRLQYPKSATLS